MQPIHKKYKNLSNSVKTLSRQQFMICALLVVSALSYCWVKYLQPEHNSWDETSIQLPDTEELQLYIDKKITQKLKKAKMVERVLPDDEQFKGLRFCPECLNILHPRPPYQELTAHLCHSLAPIL